MTELQTIWSKNWRREEEIDKSLTAAIDFITSPSIIEKISREKMSKNTEDLNNTLNQIDITDIYRTLYPITAGYTFFQNA